MSVIREASLGLLKTWTRTTSFIGKEVIETVRRPGALFSLILGPFLLVVAIAMHGGIDSLIAGSRRG